MKEGAICRAERDFQLADEWMALDDKLYPTEVLICRPEGGLTTNSVVLLNRIRSIDRQRLTKRLGKLKAKTMEQVDRAISVSLGLIIIERRLRTI
jgi:mRNA interferase MazF